jgi:ANTAR domain
MTALERPRLPQQSQHGRCAGLDSTCDDAQSPAAGGVEQVIEELRELGPGPSLNAVRELIVAAAVASLPGAVDAALTVCAAGKVRTVAQTGAVPLMVDALQYEHGGPCVEAATTLTAVVHAEDLRTDRRWPAFTQVALEQTPVLGVLAYRLSIGHDQAPVGSLNLYATKPHAFSADTITAGEGFAAYTAVLLAYAAAREKALNLEKALDRSRDIGAAIGILMTRHLITRDQAFGLLTTASQRTNRKLRDLAEDVIHTGDLSDVQRGS